jgi:perosamine synthetase
VEHPWNYYHDSVGWNYRMPNLNAALGCAQVKKIKRIIFLKRKLANIYYQNFINCKEFSIISESENCQSNYWLNIISLTKENTNHRNKILSYLIKKGYQCRPVWEPLHNLPMYKNCPRAKLVNAEKIKKKIIAMPSSPKLVS